MDTASSTKNGDTASPGSDQQRKARSASPHTGGTKRPGTGGTASPGGSAVPPSPNRPGDGSGKRTYGDLVPPGARRRWLLRGAAALAAGLAIGLPLSDWRIGATIAAATLIGISVYSARRQSEIPKWRKPSTAQRRTEAQLRVMKRFGYRVLHARRIPSGSGMIDHFVVGRRGAFSIDSETWDRRLPVYNKLNKLYHGRFAKNERLSEALSEAHEAARLVTAELGKDIEVHPSLAIYGPSMPWDIHKMDGVDVFTGTKVRKWLRTTGKEQLSDAEIDEICTAAEKVLPSRYPG